MSVEVSIEHHCTFKIQYLLIIITEDQFKNLQT